MKKRVFRIYSSVSEWNFSGLHQTKKTYVYTVPAIVPTVKNIRSVVQECFPEYQIDETYETLAEQIRNNLDIGYIFLTFKGKDDFITHGCTLEEVF